MALVHTQLYRSKNLSNIKLTDYIETLVTNIYNSYSYTNSKVALKMDIEEVILDVDTSIVLGLILNELCTNAFKYAFPSEQGSFNIIFKSNDSNNCVLVVSDDGVGLPDDFELGKTDSMGFLLITSMVQAA